ncbi:MAG: CBS domain-containing protein [Candidatus Zixiibacteriota bacterium]|nr:MAG: CBS domain-containing protein [candidate division Zixibacteria bacterium]
MKKIRAGDVMIPFEKYPHIPYWFTLRQTMAEMEKSELEVEGRKSLPRVILIFDERYHLMGMARRRDILRGLEPEFLRDKPLDDRKRLFDLKRDPELKDVSSTEIMEGIRRRAERPVSEVMIPIEVTVDYDDHIVRVVYEMNSHDVSLCPVLRNGELVGVVRSVDVFHRFAQVLL